ncbi:MAG TPA: adenylate/guanylate cyclase domain-containing protein [Burkholderiales bacterium]|nr:adenylate/guanylate cyclase domain-containing protein [Burkholderiales bacterium]
MVHCSDCGIENPRHALYCAQCGASLAMACPSCKAPASATAKFCAQCGVALTRAQPETVTPPGALRQEAERRQLTVLFCDLAGSTAMSERVDPEVLRDIIRSYQDACTGAITRWDGYIARYVGDGLLVYFGFPKAHEDAAERSVRAAINVLESVAALGKLHGQALAVRIGIATGLCVVGDIVGTGAAQEQTVVGETPNLAARLQGVATPNSVVISAGTKDLLGSNFVCESLGPLELKGLSQPIKAWRVAATREVESRFDAAHGDRLSRFVGREQEIGLLMQRWRQAAAGEGQLVLLVGEAGIGKSRITDALRAAVEREDLVRLRFQCSPHHVNSPLHPVIKQMRFAARIAADDSDQEKLDKLERLIGNPTDVTREAPLLSRLLSLPGEQRYGLLRLSAQEERQHTLRALLAMFERLSRAKPLLFVFEDAHWIDPTTRELLDLIVDRIAGLRALMVVTHRPEFDAYWSTLPFCSVVTLNRLSKTACAALIDDLAGGMPLPKEVQAQIMQKTDGIPLFVEELTKTVLESGLLERGTDRYLLAGPLPPLAIPSTLQDSLMARLDRLEGVKEIGQIGAAIGREFSLALLDAVAPIHGPQLDSALARLADSELIFRRGVPPELSFVFKHALIQDAAYESLLRSRRQQIHARIAEALRTQFPERAQAEPELVAAHYQRAGLFKEAAPYWLLAGQRAVTRSANVEAIAHLTEGLEALRNLAQAPERDGLELDMQVSLGSARIAMRGYSAPETESAYTRGRELLARLGDDPRQFAVLHGLCMVYWNRAEFVRMLEVAQDMLARAERKDDSLSLLVAHRVMAVALNPMGRFEEARAHAEKAVALYDRRLHRDSAHQYGHDQGVGAYWHLAVAALFLGDVEMADRAAREAGALATELQNANTSLYSSLYLSFTNLAKSDWEATRRAASEMVENARERSMALWVVFGRHHLGSALAALGEWEAALLELRQARAQADDISNTVFTTMTLRYEAEALAGLGRTDEALECLERAIALGERTEERWYEAEIYRARAAIRRRLRQASAAIHADLDRAIAVARRQKAALFERRARADLEALQERA